MSYVRDDSVLLLTKLSQMNLLALLHQRISFQFSTIQLFPLELLIVIVACIQFQLLARVQFKFIKQFFVCISSIRLFVYSIFFLFLIHSQGGGVCVCSLSLDGGFSPKKALSPPQYGTSRFFWESRSSFVVFLLPCKESFLPSTSCLIVYLKRRQTIL